ncbi:MAG TPA: CHASE4 domain-containing protein [Spirochaetia bacterium]|nr:CHASE4 domain-containing protein [Spirochaetia bacterium]
MLRRILFFIGLTFVVMFAIITVATRTILMEGFSRLEKTFMERNVARVQNAVADELSDLGRTTQDWAGWDDTYRFVSDLNLAYVKSNLNAGTFTNLRLSVIVYLDPRGRQIYGRMLDPAGSTLKAVPDDFRTWLLAHPEMVLFHANDAHAEGIVTIREGIFLVAARPILDSDLRGPIRGTLVFARLFDQAEMQRLARNLRLAVTFSRLADPAMPPDFARALASLSRQRPLVLDAEREEVITGYAILPGGAGASLLMRVDLPRDIHKQGEQTRRYFMIWLLLVGIIFGGVVLLVIQRTVLYRLHQLSAGVLAIGTSGSSGARVPAKGRDQIAYLAAAINGMLEALEKSTDQLRKSEQRNEAFLDAIPDLILRISRDGTLIDARQPPSHLGDPQRWLTLVGKDVSEIPSQFPSVPNELLEQGRSAVARALETSAPQSFSFTVPSDDGPRHYETRIACSGADETVVLVRDVTAQKQAEEARRRDVMVKEIHHRVKNNLQVISSLLALQASSSAEPRTRALLDESRDRVRSMALIHEKLYEAGPGREAGYADYVRDLVTQLLRSYGLSQDIVAVRIEVDEIPMDMDQSVPLGLIINELVSNALAHAFPDGRHGTIMVTMKRCEGGDLRLVVSDDGVGLPAGVDWRAPVSLGLRIVNILAEQVRAVMEVETERGTVFTLTLPAG